MQIMGNKTINMKNLIFILISISLYSQNNILQNFPSNQIPYKDGYVGFYKDFHDIVIEKNMQPCQNPQEMYQFNVLITQDSEIKFIKDFGGKQIAENKCAYDLARTVAKYQKGWIAA
ncbi:hypothetical protein GCM10023200_60540 [Actinomycetospora chlora]